MAILKETGYRNVKELWYSLGGPLLEDRLELLSDDKGACHVVNIAIMNGQAHLFVVHMVSQPDYIHMLEYHSQPELGEVQGVQVEGGEVEGGELEVGDIEVGQVKVDEVVEGEAFDEVGQEELVEVEVGQQELLEVEVGQEELDEVEVEDGEVQVCQHGEEGDAEVEVGEHDEVEGGQHTEEGDGDVDEVVQEHAELDEVSKDTCQDSEDNIGGGVGDGQDEVDGSSWNASDEDDLVD
ncbi:sodium/potassium/calcium exchanger 1-like isoform X1 [Vigna radiata var. radiata]|uniref:Sodium/potassium/calcium exchanger 1-like isoform X1 n=1 Tax=Vigna radiata var. radiata TaxID=3916 RepID=A0A3Q0ENF0_VIGRR|nr:sodium/potassium/calcium exchanger 1-like isoform X1 [Vigna radiata var. radiata]